MAERLILKDTLGRERYEPPSVTVRKGTCLRLGPCGLCGHTMYAPVSIIERPVRLIVHPECKRRIV